MGEPSAAPHLFLSNPVLSRASFVLLLIFGKTPVWAGTQRGRAGPTALHCREQHQWDSPGAGGQELSGDLYFPRLSLLIMTVLKFRSVACSSSWTAALGEGRGNEGLEMT